MADEAIDATPAKERPPRPIATVRTIHGMSHEAFVRMQLPGRIRRLLVSEAIFQALALPPCDFAVEARVDHGRWIVDCPFCAGAEMFDPEDPRFFCLSCYNEKAEGRWLQVVAPPPRRFQAIEKALQERSDTRLQHWRPGVSVAELQSENLAQEAA